MRLRPEATLSHTTRAETRRRHTGRAQRVPGTFPLESVNQGVMMIGHTLLYSPSGELVECL